MGSMVIPVLDENGRPETRGAFAPVGWAYQNLTIEFTTSKLNSLVDVRRDGTSRGLASIRYYDGSDVELTSGTQLELDLNCVKTLIEIEFPFDIEVISGLVLTPTVPITDLRLYVLLAPDIPYTYGGSFEFINGFNLRHLSNGIMKFDGRSSKKIEYNATDHRGKWHFIFKHALGTQTDISCGIEYFRDPTNNI